MVGHGALNGARVWSMRREGSLCATQRVDLFRPSGEVNLIGGTVFTARWPNSSGARTDFREGADSRRVCALEAGWFHR
jgi:hypothetical protein